MTGRKGFLMQPQADKQFSKKFLRGVIIVIIIMLIVAIIGIGYRMNEFRKLRRVTNRQASINVAVIKAAAESVNEEIVLPGNVTAWHDATIYARTNGYLIQWLVDIGAHVHTGDLLALIAAPEVDAQLRQTEADLVTAEANYYIAHTTADRWRNLLKTDSVSKQETEEKISSEKATAAIVNSTRANRDRLRDLVSYERVIAPFDGVIMSRNTDIGRLINAGSGTVPLFRLVQSNRLRVYVQIPQYYSANIGPDFTAKLYFTEHPGQTYTAKLLDSAKAIDPNTRTLLSQFEIDNADYQLLAGGYTEAHLIIPVHKRAVRLPVNTLIFRSQGMQVATIDGDSKVLLKPITIGRDFGDSVEVVAGVRPGESIIVNPPDSIFAGEKVHIVSHTGKKAVKKSS
jgi:RND family efflux transporter MFP subunit